MVELKSWLDRSTNLVGFVSSCVGSGPEVGQREGERGREGARGKDMNNVTSKSSRNKGQSKGQGRGRHRFELHVVVVVVVIVELRGESRRCW